MEMRRGKEDEPLHPSQWQGVSRGLQNKIFAIKVKKTSYNGNAATAVYMRERTR